MKNLKFILVILLFYGISYAQGQAISQTEEVDTVQIEHRAVAAAKSDFNTLKKLGWGGSSIIIAGGVVALVGPGERSGFVAGVPVNLLLGLLSPPAAAYLTPVNVPQNREMEVSSKGNDYQTVYRLAYGSATRKQRLKYLLAGPLLLGGLFVVGALVLLLTWQGV